MPDVISDDELNALAAEYVLGTLDYEERRGASALLEVDATFRGIVRIWEKRFGDLHLMVEAVDPDPQLWQRIKPKVPAIEQVALAIPSHADEPAVAPAAAPTPAPETPAATEVAAATPAPEAAVATPAPEATVAEPKADAAAAEATAPANAETTPATAETPPAGETPPAESKPAESKPTESKPAAIAEAELKLAELAALLPVPGGHAGAGTAQAETVPEDGLHTHAPDLVPRGFVPPAPMSTRGTPAVVEVPVRETSRGWIAATTMMGLVAVVLAGLIGAWRYFPERLPAPLRAYSVLNLPVPPQAPVPKALPKLAPFDE